MDRSFLGQNKRRVSFFHVKHAYLTLRIGLPTRYEREPKITLDQLAAIWQLVSHPFGQQRKHQLLILR